MIVYAEELADAVAERNFSGVVRVDRGSDCEFEAAYGLADRAHGVPVEVGTRFGVASGVKTFTALTVLALVEEGTLELGTTARSLLGDDLPLIGDDVTVELLLQHRSGIGDHVDEDLDLDDDAYVLEVPPHTLVETEAYVPVLDGRPPKFAPGERFGYCNAGFVLLALLAERAAGVGFHQLVMDRVCRPAGLTGTDFLRSDELPGDAALGYLYRSGLRTNVLHLPVIGTGDGGIYTTAADVAALWTAMYAGSIVPAERVAWLTQPHSIVPEEEARYGAGVWLDESGPQVEMRGADAGVSFRSMHDPTTGVTWTVLCNTSDAAWPVARRLQALLG